MDPLGLAGECFAGDDRCEIVVTGQKKTDALYALRDGPRHPRPRNLAPGETGAQRDPCDDVPGPRNVLNKAIAEANARRRDALRRINKAIRDFGTKEAYPIVQGIHIETSLWFVERVRTGGVWDFKKQPDTFGNQDFGNFAFGATSDALGYGDFSHIAADIYSLYENRTFEDKDDMIDRGQAYYRNGCQGR